MDGHPTIRVLGPIELVAPAGVIQIGGRQLRALLGALVIGAGHAVPNDHLSWVIWGDELPRTSENSLQSYVSNLRRLLGPDTIIRTDHSYELAVGAVGIDAIDFEGLLRQAEDARTDPTTCWQLCHDALALWHGRPFGDLADDEPFSLEAHRLDELRFATMELSIEADLSLGHPDLVVGELEGAVQEHPYRERLWYLLIEALMLAGRRVEALRACQQLRHVLHEVGVEIGPDITDLERRVLDGGGHATGRAHRSQSG